MMDDCCSHKRLHTGRPCLSQCILVSCRVKHMPHHQLFKAVPLLVIVKVRSLPVVCPIHFCAHLPHNNNIKFLKHVNVDKIACGVMP